MPQKWRSPTDTGSYASWRAMRSRCLNPNDPSFHRYGAKGVLICVQWLDDFDQFYADMGDRPDGCTLDRKRNSLGYTPDNCRWATRAEQVKNRACTVLVTHDGHTRTLAEWAAYLGVPYRTVWNRIRLQGMKPSKALTAARLQTKQWNHGTTTGYARGCRCELCKAARATWYLSNKRKEGSSRGS